MVVVAGAAGLLPAVGGGVGDDVASRDQVELAAFKEAGELFQLLGVGDVDGDLVREEEDALQIRHAHGGDLPPHQLRHGLLGPGELVDGEIDLEALPAQLRDDPLVAGGEGIEGPREEGHGPRFGIGEGQLVHPAADQETVQMVEDRRLRKAGVLAMALLGEQAEELLSRPDAEVLPPPVGEAGRGQHPLAEHGKGGLVDGVVVVGDAGQQNAQDLIGPAAHGLRQLRQEPAQGQKAGRGRPYGGGADQIAQIVQALRQLLVRKLRDQDAQIIRDEGRDLILPGFELAQQVYDDLVLLVQRQQVRQLQQGASGPLPDRKMLAHREQVGQVHGRVEGVLRVGQSLLGERVDLCELHDPVDRGLQVAQIELGGLQLGQSLAPQAGEHVALGSPGLRRQKALQPGQEPGLLRRFQHGLELLEPAQDHHAQGLLRELQLFQQRIGQPVQPLRTQPVQGQIVDAVDQREKGLAALGFQPAEQRLEIGRDLLRRAAFKQGSRDDLQRV